MARELSETFNPNEQNDEEIKKNVQRMRTRAFSAKDAEAKANQLQAAGKKKHKTEPPKPQPSRPNQVREYTRRAAPLPLPAKPMVKEDAKKTEDVKMASVAVPKLAAKPSAMPEVKPLRASSRRAGPDVAPVTETKEVEEETTKKIEPSPPPPKAAEAPSPPEIAPTAKAPETLANPKASPVEVEAVKLNVKAGTSVLDCPEIGPGWKVNIVPRTKVTYGKQCDYYYYSPSGERFRTLKGAHADARAKGTNANANGTDNEQKEHAPAQKKSTEVQKSPGEFGVGYTFKKQFGDEKGNDLGWFEGKVVDIVSGSGKLKM